MASVDHCNILIKWTFNLFLVTGSEGRTTSKGKETTLHGYNPSPSRFSTEERTCNICAKTFNHKCLLSSHLRTVHFVKSHRQLVLKHLESHKVTINTVQSYDKNKSKSGVSMQSVESHNVTEQTNQSRDNGQNNRTQYNCAQCGRTFRLWSKFTYHQRMTHERKYRCTKCDRRVNNILDLQEHVHKKHRREVHKARQRYYRCGIEGWDFWE